MLDIGCASGGLLALLRPRAGHLAGLELSASAATAAAQIADHVVQGALEDPDLPFEEGSFDLVVLADVLEHLADPAAGLARAVRWCRPGGAVLVSVPNVAHWQARLTLLRGRWPQTDSGTFDASHLRWFTRDALAGCSPAPACATSSCTRSSRRCATTRPPRRRRSSAAWSPPGSRSGAAPRGCSATRSSASAGAEPQAADARSA